MIARVFAILAASSALLAVTAVPYGGSVDQCNSGQVYCCNQMTKAESMDHSTKTLLSLAHVDVGSLKGYVASNCSPIGVLAIGSAASCSSQQVCCQDNHYNGLINVGCSPINVAL